MKFIAKRIMAVVVSLIGILIASPLFFIIAILIKLEDRGPVLFKQKRVGQGGKIFTFLKFRSMVVDAEKIGLGKTVAEYDDRITRIGKFIREWTLDELPQLINVFRGDMDLVGPRPLPPYDGTDEKIKKLWQKRITIRPGLMSIVDARGRNLVPFEKRFEYDAWYIDHQSLWLDFKIMVQVLLAVLSRKGVYGQGGVNETLDK